MRKSEHPGGSVLIDANLLLVLLTGVVERRSVGRTKRTGAYTPEMWDLLAAHVDSYRRIVVTPNVLTEVSNLSDFGDARLRDQLRRHLGNVAAASEELYVESRSAVGRPEFVRLGLTDAAILTLTEQRLTVLTSDLPLYVALAAVGIPAVNFWHLAAAARLTE